MFADDLIAFKIIVKNLIKLLLKKNEELKEKGKKDV